MIYYAGLALGNEPLECERWRVELRVDSPMGPCGEVRVPRYAHPVLRDADEVWLYLMKTDTVPMWRLPVL